jgi:SAM-dependent methyltransferase
VIVDAHVQRRVARTNGNLYVPLVNRLPRYPISRWPAEPPASKDSLLLDIGCGWGRWMVSAAQAGYVPVGIDVQPEHLFAARRVLRDHGLRGYVVAADLRALPFASNVFDKVFSYSVLQHAHRQACASGLRDIRRVLKPGGSCSIEFPVSHGLTNWRHSADSSEDDPDSWCVRYYTHRALRVLFGSIFGNAAIQTDCFFGIGVRREDFDLLPWKYKPVVAASELLKFAAKFLPPLRWLSDSVFVHSSRPGRSVTPLGAASPFGQDHNLWILPWLQCPVAHCPLDYDRASHTLISRGAGLRYPIDHDVPLLLEASAAKL